MDVSAIETIDQVQPEEYTSLTWSVRLKAYYELSKPGITQMVVLTAAAGYYLAVPSTAYFSSVPHLLRFAMMLIGTALISAGACSMNQYLERDDDAHMKRTRTRPIPSGVISPASAMVFSTICSVAGLMLLASIDSLTCVLAALTYVVYTVLYTPMKKKTWMAMFIGAIPGALPAMGGWTAGAGSLGVGGWVLFTIMVLWQMPHFLALSIMYRQDYEGGGFVLLGKSFNANKTEAAHALMYALVLFPVALALWMFGIAGSLYAIGCSALSVLFIVSAVRVVRDSTVANARKMLLSSYAFLMGVFLFMFVDKI